MLSSAPFDAFISYSHANRVEAERLQKKLEGERFVKRFQKPKLHICRDETDFGAHPSLSDQIKENLSKSDHLIVLLSEATLTSPHVVNEIDYYCDHLQRGHRVILVVLSGSINPRHPDCVLPERFKADMPYCMDFRTKPQQKENYDKILAFVLDAPVRNLRTLRTRLTARNARIAVGCFALLACLGYYFGFFAEHQAYYKDYQRTATGWQGIVPLSKSQARTSTDAYRFTYQGWYHSKLIRAERLRGLVRPLAIKGILHTDLNRKCSNHFAWRVNFHYKGNSLQSEEYIDQYQQLFTRLVYLNPTTSQFADQNFGCTSYYTDVQYVKQSHDPATNTTRFSFLDKNTQPTTNKTGYSTLEVRYDDQSRPIEERYFDQNNQAVDINGIHKKTFDRPQENQILTAFFNRQGKPSKNAENCFAQIKALDSNRNVRTQTCLNRHHIPITGKSGVASFHMQYDDRGNLVHRNFAGPTDEPAYHTDGYVSQRSTFTPQGFRASTQYLDHQQMPVAIEDDTYAYVELDYNPQGSITEKRFYGVSGALTPTKSGYAIRANRYTPNGYKSEIIYLDAKRQPTLFRSTNRLTPGDYFGIKRIFDQRGHLAEQLYLDAKGQLMNADHGFARMVKTYNDAGRILTQRFFDQNGMATTYRGYHLQTSRYQDNTLVEILHYAKDNRTLALRNKGYAGWRSVLDDQHREIRVSYIGANNAPVRRPEEGYAIETYGYDPQGNKTEERYWDTDGRTPVISKWGHAGWRKSFDDQNRVTSIAFLGLDGRPLLQEEGYAVRTYQYNAEGKHIATHFFGEDGKTPALTKWGYASWLSTFDGAGNTLETRYFGTKGQPSLRSEDNYATVIKAYDSRNNLIHEHYLDEKGNPTAPFDGHFDEQTFSYHPYRNTLKTKTFLFRGNPTNNAYGYAAREMRYNTSGKETLRALYDEKGRLSNSTNSPWEYSDYNHAVILHRYHQDKHYTVLLDENLKVIRQAKGAAIGLCFEGDNKRRCDCTEEEFQRFFGGLDSIRASLPRQISFAKHEKPKP